MKKSILTVFILCSSLAGFSQGFVKFNDQGWDFHIGLGVQNTNLGDRYNAFALDKVYGNDQADLTNPNTPVSYPKPSSSLYLASIGGFGVSSGILYGAEVNYGMSNTVESSAHTSASSQGSMYSLKTSYYTTSVLVQVGAIIYRNSVVVLYPYAGLGYGGAAIRLKNDDPGNKVYPVMATGSEKDNKVLWNANLTYEFGIGADFMFGKGKSSGDAGGFKLGIRAGIMNQAAGYNLKSNGDKVQDDIKSNSTAEQYTNPKFYQNLPSHPTGPITNENQLYKKLGMSAPYIKLIIGVGRVGKK